MPYYDDNFGCWDDDADMYDEDFIRFYNQVQRESVTKECVICGRTVRLRPQYDKCDACCRALENGFDPY